VRSARPRHHASGLESAERSEGGRRAALALALMLVASGCSGGSDATPGGAADLPGTVPEGVAYADPPKGAPAAPPFSARLLDGTPVSAADLWAERPLLLVFTASWCGRCAELHRDLAAAADEYGDAVALLGVVAEDDAEPAVDYADKLDLGRPIAAASERVWLNYAAREPPVVVLISRGGKVLRGWPGGLAPEALGRQLDRVVLRRANP
jgi:thiol-disulfide isomerase/thioredoxin